MPRCSSVVLASALLAGVAFGPVAIGFARFSAPTAPSRVPAAAAVAARRASAGGEEAASGEVLEPTRLASAAVSLLAALLVALAPVAEAQAARTGGRIGSSAPSQREQKQRPSVSRPAEPKVINRTTVINKTVVAPPPPPPVIVAPAPVIAAPLFVAPPPPTLGDVLVGAAVSSAINSTIPRGPSVNDRIMENQMRQDERQLDKQATQIDDLKREIQELQQKK
mmetsp:Transcript_8491/g.27061  ORF Transcript_8491/g.27061 Transcript_8491/m.27061 type:complete len:223 (+) Transcript_8491:64-732(+)|eukprot:CAMPEP_0204578342 /NCGR_PEP_ID=MMETSP0661-20131031/42866_1 /ASSEMBLY_ACC=CAM_ASM_000606 /TAXON_ID=109239 /ORGANISM="Alexandrium margalefi, Strain AMGDE01CS-322" /LENGTH=222 /DNA_ID=CAMNT_0051587265 /DNA_START=62 /DNA_END=730 /DNA_ORIENTATION=+